jgi:hypothetical protein
LAGVFAPRRSNGKSGLLAGVARPRHLAGRARVVSVGVARLQRRRRDGVESGATRGRGSGNLRRVVSRAADTRVRRAVPRRGGRLPADVKMGERVFVGHVGTVHRADGARRTLRRLFSVRLRTRRGRPRDFGRVDDRQRSARTALENVGVGRERRVCRLRRRSSRSRPRCCSP